MTNKLANKEIHRNLMAARYHQMRYTFQISDSQTIDALQDVALGYNHHSKKQTGKAFVVALRNSFGYAVWYPTNYFDSKQEGYYSKYYATDPIDLERQYAAACESAFCYNHDC